MKRMGSDAVYKFNIFGMKVISIWVLSVAHS
jgi:hypothetical protein